MTHAYLVIANYTRDDFPLRLFEDYDAAERYAKRCRYCDLPDKLFKALNKDAAGVGAWDAVDIRITRFTDGVPDSTVVIRSLDECAKEDS